MKLSQIFWSKKIGGLFVQLFGFLKRSIWCQQFNMATAAALCFTAPQRVRIYGRDDSSRYQAILDESVLPSFRKLSLGRGSSNSAMKKKTSKQIRKRIDQKNNFQILERPSECHDLNQIENNVKKAMHTRIQLIICNCGRFAKKDGQ